MRTDSNHEDDICWQEVRKPGNPMGKPCSTGLQNIEAFFGRRKGQEFRIIRGLFA
jgi:hypothetical protein